MFKVPIKHRVKSGENLTLIAAKYKIKKWREIYDAPCNDTFREKRRDPDKIKPGDVIYIPTSKDSSNPEVKAATVAKIETILKRLKAVRKEAEQLFGQSDKQLAAMHSEAKRFEQGVDVAATLINLSRGLGGLAQQGMKASAATGEALAKINRAVAKDTAQGLGKKALEATAYITNGAIKEDKQDSAIMLFGKAAADAYLKVGSPSFWAHAYIQLSEGKGFSAAMTFDPEKERAKAAKELAHVRKAALDNIDKKIAGYEQALKKLKAAD